MKATHTQPQNRKPYEFLLNQAANTCDILIYGGIGDLDWETFTRQNMSKQFRQELNAAAEKVDQVNVRINSPGGLAFEGIAIANAIAQCPTPVHTYVDGLAASAAAVIALSGHKVHMAENALLMLHNASVCACGNAKELREQAEMLDKADQAIVATIASRSGIEKEDAAAKYMNHTDTWLTAAEAKEAGLCDHVVTSVEAAALPPEPTAMTWNEVLSWYKDREPKPEPATNSTNHPNPFPMDIKALQDALETGELPVPEAVKTALLSEARTASKQIEDATKRAEAAEASVEAIRNAAGVEEGADLAEAVTNMREEIANQNNSSAGSAAPDAPAADENDEPQALTEAEAALKRQSDYFANKTRHLV